MSGLIATRFGQGRAMTQRFQPRQSEKAEQIWLSALVEAMEEVSRAGPCARCDDRAARQAIITQLTRPAPTYLQARSNSADETKAPIRPQSAV
jgi:hypothetical protein